MSNSISVRFLYESDFKVMHKCFLESFKDYAADISYMTQEILLNRMEMGRVSITNCIGAFYKNRMIGFINVGIGLLEGKLSAWDGGTGVIKEFRGRGVTGKMFNLVKERLTELKVQNFYLEVFQGNVSAIKAYKKENFEIVREFECLDLDSFNQLNDTNTDIYEIKDLSKEDLKRYTKWISYKPSWEYSLESTLNISSNLVIKGVFKSGDCIGFAAFNNMLNWISMIGFTPESDVEQTIKILLKSLIPHLGKKSNKIGINNIESNTEIYQLLKKVDFKLAVKQYEMVLKLETKD